MGDLANMTDHDGRVNGFRLLRWLHSRAQLAEQLESEYRACGEPVRAAHHGGQVAVLTEMADDLEAELTPPDYPEDDGEGIGPYPTNMWRECPDCGNRHNDGSHVDGCCPACVGRRLLALTEDGVELDDPALTNGPEEERKP